jgi:head-tail adaptor
MRMTSCARLRAAAGTERLIADTEMLIAAAKIWVAHSKKLDKCSEEGLAHAE